MEYRRLIWVTVKKGDCRQNSVINCELFSDDIEKAMALALTEEFKNKARNTVNPYGGTNTSREIVGKLKEFLLDDKINLKKRFYDIE